METSAKTGLNVDLAFTAVARQVISFEVNILLACQVFFYCLFYLKLMYSEREFLL